MKKLLLACLVIFSFVGSYVSAKEEVELNVFGYPDKTIVKVIKTDNPLSESNLVLPDCNDEKLLAKVKETVIPFMNNELPTIENKRRKLLILKNISNFAEIDAESLSLNDNKAAIAGVLEIKINKNLGTKKLKICKSRNPILTSDLYVMIYEFDGKVNVDIVNFVPNHNPSFEFIQD